ncbi:MMPL family transporter [Thioalkalivibrio sp. ALE19]|uniref:MMPL family transporter n=1 Tax=Thioalkalivibrio sp. ALE19 TaxID=1266909 RepID=UPI0004145ED3|nr:MMPL family transporter [Thioalkalivibrio sp. ALE19]
MSSLPSRAAVTLWLAGLLIAALVLALRGEMATDLGRFMPDPGAEAGLPLDVDGGPGARQLLLAIEGGDAARRAAASDGLADALRGDPAVAGVHNGRGDFDPEALEAILDLRYLLSPAVTPERFSREHLDSAFAERRDDLSSAVPAMPRELIPRDPTGELLELGERLRDPFGDATRGEHGVWTDPAGERALLVVRIAPAAEGLEEQTGLLQRVEQEFAALEDADLRLLQAGPPAIAVESRERIRAEVTAFSLAASLALAVLLLVVFRHPHPVWLAAIPLGSGILAGAAVVTLVFGHLHGIALAFGITVLGVALDYPLHLFAHAGRRAAARVAGELWPALVLGAGSTALVYALMAATSFPGMAQLGLFVLTGILVAAAVTRWVLPALLPRGARERGLPEPRLPLPSLRPRGRRAGLGLLLVAILAALAVLLSRDPFPWNDQLTALNPVPEEAIALDRELRDALGLPDVRHLVLIRGESADAVLQAAHALDEPLEALRDAGAITGFDHPAQILPDTATQRARQAALPERDTLAEHVERAVRDHGFQAEAFTPFLDDVERSRKMDPVTPDRLPDGPLRQALEPLLLAPGEHSAAGHERAWIGQVLLRGLSDAGAVSQGLDAGAPADGAEIGLVDLRATTEAMVADFRTAALTRLALAALAVTALLWLLTRDPGRSLRIVTAVAAGLLLTTASLLLLGIELTLFHLIALMLVIGLGLDYAVFLGRPGAMEPDEARRTRRSVTLCALSTGLVFALLALSSLPVLRALGLTVALGVVFSYVAALLLARPVNPSPTLEAPGPGPGLLRSRIKPSP